MYVQTEFIIHEIIQNKRGVRTKIRECQLGYKRRYQISTTLSEWGVTS